MFRCEAHFAAEVPGFLTPGCKRTQANISTTYAASPWRPWLVMGAVVVIFVSTQDLYTIAFGSSVDRDWDDFHGIAARPRTQAIPADPGDAPRGQSSSLNEKSGPLEIMVHDGMSPGARLMIEGLRKLADAQQKLAVFLREAAKRCREGEELMCGTPEEPISRRSGIVLPEPPVIRQFILPDDPEIGRSSNTASSDPVKTQESTADVTTIRRPKRQRWKPPVIKTNHPLQPRWGTDRLKGGFETAPPEEAFVEIRTGGFFDMLNNLFLGGAGSADPANFEGGNQGSYFDFMYPLQTDYPWACTCDPNIFERWENKEVSNVPCRNQVDMSAQGVTAYCNPLVHKMNGSFRPGSGASVFSFMAVSLSFMFSFI
ncbi:hypothetical protein TGMAS_212270 [Toxoplasma gondii MAS]|uniref:Uncharacterized protein n=1 Tax=Toxoplasma gondii MAS TaxID=943118 RepID=A0A086PND2_TOXGO|nr:hypothetical protein TGMAS_212270 [Toxoplasma gondii MAS]